VPGFKFQVTDENSGAYSLDSSKLRKYRWDERLAMALIIFEVVSGGTKKNHPPGGEDWSVLVAARSPAEARDIACHETEIDRPWAIYEWGTDARPAAKPGVLRGPFENCPAVCRGWKMYEEDRNDDGETPKVVEHPLPPPIEADLTSKSPRVQCSHCAKITSGDSYFTITATGYMDKGKTGNGRIYSSADLVGLSLWQVADYETRRMHELKMIEARDGVVNIICCSAECLKNYLCTSVDKLVAATPGFNLKA
jgi:hypothetical protein